MFGPNPFQISPGEVAAVAQGTYDLFGNLGSGIKKRAKARALEGNRNAIQELVDTEVYLQEALGPLAQQRANFNWNLGANQRNWIEGREQAGRDFLIQRDLDNQNFQRGLQADQIASNLELANTNNAAALQLAQVNNTAGMELAGAQATAQKEIALLNNQAAAERLREEAATRLALGRQTLSGNRYQADTNLRIAGMSAQTQKEIAQIQALSNSNSSNAREQTNRYDIAARLMGQLV